MTLDEAIKCTEKLAKEFKLDAEISITKYAKENLNRLADEYEQLDSWFKELKERREDALQTTKCGRWENEHLEDDVWWADCTNCKNETHSNFGRVSSYAFCPNCGARMDGDIE